MGCRTRFRTGDPGADRGGGAATALTVRLSAAVVERAEASGLLEEAAATLRALLRRWEGRPELWRALVRAYEQLGRPAEAGLARAPLVVLNAAADPPGKGHWVPEPGRLPPGVLARAQVAALGVDGAVNAHAADLLACLSGTLSKIAPMELGERGLSRKDRIEAGDDHPLRATLDRLAAVLGIECDLYVHTGRGALVTIGLTDPTSLVVSARLGALPPAQQVFLLGRALLAIALDLQATLLFSGRDLRALLDATTALDRPRVRRRRRQARRSRHPAQEAPPAPRAPAVSGAWPPPTRPRPSATSTPGSAPSFARSPAPPPCGPAI